VNSPAAVSSGWQLIFLSFAIVVVLLEMVRGWRLGLMRQLVRLVGVLSAYASAVWGGSAVVPFVRGIFRMPDTVLSLIGGAILAFVVYAIIATLGTVLFKRTNQHEAGIVRAVWGSSGAVLGIFFGLFFVWLVFAGVRLIGSVAAAQVHSQELATNKMMMPVWNRPLRKKGKSSSGEPSGSELVTTLARIKTSLEGGSLGGALQQVDPLPPAAYRTLEKLGTVAGNVESAERFLSFPGAREIGENPKVVALRSDPEITDLITHGRILELLQNQRLIDAANDPALREQIRRFDLERALDYAIQGH
jgi:hypothetical protein